MLKYDWNFVATTDVTETDGVLGPFSDSSQSGQAPEAVPPLGIAESQLADLAFDSGLRAGAFEAANPFYGNDGVETFVALPAESLLDAEVPGLAAVADATDSLLGAGDLIFVDGGQFAKGGVPGPNGGGNKGGGGDDTDSDVLSEYTSGSSDGSGYNITVDFKGSWSSDLQQAFIDSADSLSATITGDIADVFFRGKIIDDITITAELKAIDGEGGILGQAGPTAIRTDGYLPATAIMQFDSADAVQLNAEGWWDEVVMHEMTHSVGFGTVWDYLGLVSGSGTADPLFTGENATLTYDAVTAGDQSAGVPLEQDGGAGTAESHWDEETFTSDLMTGYLSPGTASTLSEMTVASLEDLGYETVWTPDPYSTMV